MKKLGSLTFIFVFTAVLFTSNAFAATGTFDQIYMTSADGDTTEKTIFGWDETPYLYLRLPEPSLNFTGSLWQSPEVTYHFVGNELGFDQEQWLSIDDWDTIKKTGEWNVQAMYLAPSSSGLGSTKFSVTPEPISMSLFLLGGVTLVSRRFSRKRNSI